VGCILCGSGNVTSTGYCPSCTQKVSYADLYPDFLSIVTDESVPVLSDRASNGKSRIVVKCPRCRRKTEVSVKSLITQYRRNVRNGNRFAYRCHTCSKEGSSGVGLRDVMPVIDFRATEERFGGIPANVKKGKVVALCEDCGDAAEVKLSSILHQARRHRKSGRDCVYKCFGCGVRRPDALRRSADARNQQLADGFRSGLEVAMANRLDHLGVRHQGQFQVDMWTWDFHLPDHALLIDVNGEYWHSLNKRAAQDRDRAKVTYLERHRPEFSHLVVEERSFLNPLMVDRIILDHLGLSPDLCPVEFSLSDVEIRSLELGRGSSRSPYVDFLNSYHYAQCGRLGKAVTVAFLGEEMVGVCKFNTVTRKETARTLGLKCGQVMELDRFCIHPRYHKKNFGSWLLSRCVKALLKSKPEVMGLVSFAYPIFGHSGTIYKAANWELVGRTRPSYHYMDSTGVPINKKRVYDIASKLRMTEREYVKKHGLERFREEPKLKFTLRR